MLDKLRPAVQAAIAALGTHLEDPEFDGTVPGEFRDELKLAGFDYCRKSLGMCFKLYEIKNKNLAK